LGDLLRLLSLFPGGTTFIAWCNALLAMSFGQAVLELGRLFFQFVGLWEFFKYGYRWLFRRRSRLEQQVEALEHRINERNQTIDELRATRDRLTAELKAARDELPGAAIARAEREWRDFNQERAVRHLENWFAGNAGSIADIARHLARYHIARSVPDPADHLARARDMLRLARGAAPEDREAHELAGELDMINAALQEQLIRDGERQIPWNSGMARFLAGQGEALLPLVTTFRDIARWCFDKGMWRLTPIFAERAVDLAQQAGRPLRRAWCQAAKDAAFYQLVVGHAAEAFCRIDDVLSQAQEYLALRDPVLLGARFVRAYVLRNLGRYREALAEIDAFAPIQREVQGERHPDTLATRYLRALVLRDLGRYREALAEIDTFAPIRAEVQGGRHPDTLTACSLRALVLRDLGRYGEALAEIDAVAPIRREVQGERHPDTLATRQLRAYVLRNLGRYREALAEIDAFAPIQREVQGERHADTLATRYLRALVLRDLGRYGEALAEIDAFAPIQHEVQGKHHPDTLTTRYLRAQALSDLERDGEALEEIDALAPILIEVRGARHPDTLATRYLRAQVLGTLGRYGEAQQEIDAFAPVEAEVKGARHPHTLITRSLRIGIEIAGQGNVDRATELRGIIEGLRATTGTMSRQTLRARYRLARLLFQQGKLAEARTEIADTIQQFDPATDPGDTLLRSARALLDMIDGRPSEIRLLV
jgi:tetratricopeptide (TPR) repeat protein